MSSQTIDKHAVAYLNDKVKELQVANETMEKCKVKDDKMIGYLRTTNATKIAEVDALKAVLTKKDEEVVALKQVCDRLKYDKDLFANRCEVIYARIEEADTAASLERYAVRALETMNLKLMA